MPREYFAYATSVEMLGDGRKDVTLDAIPTSIVKTFFRNARDAWGQEYWERQCQAQFYERFPDGGVVISCTYGPETPGGDDKKIIRGGFRPDRWYHVFLTEGGSLSVWHADDLLAEPESGLFDNAWVVTGWERRCLDVLFTLRGRLSDEDTEPNRPDRKSPDYRVSRWSDPSNTIGYVLSQLSANAFRMVGVINVGQGACASLYDEFGRPVVYFDFGFPCRQNAKTAPWNIQYLKKAGAVAAAATLPLEEVRNPRPCLCMDPLIILSHGDHDHWYLAKMMENEVTQLPFLAPESVSGPSLNGLWRKLSNKRTLVRGEWLAFSWGYVTACTGTGRNNSGIAVFVRVKDDPSKSYPMPSAIGLPCLGPPVFSAAEEYVLLPGDAEFRHIPGLGNKNLRLVGLVASHHGASFAAKSAFRNLPGPAVQKSPIVYSYGLKDAGASDCMRPYRNLYRVTLPPEARPNVTQTACYRDKNGEGHPRLAAVTAYAQRGWSERRNTARDETHGRNTLKGNWLLGSSVLRPFSGQSVVTCHGLSCPQNRGCRALRLEIA